MDIMTQGRYSYGSPVIHCWTDRHRLIIGSFTSIASGVHIFLEDGFHNPAYITTYPFTSKEFRSMWFPPDTPERFDQLTSKGDVVIGNDVWIGEGAIIMSGVKIGDGAIIGAGSVVTMDIEPYSIAAGNPARAIRLRYNTAIIRDLLSIKWWDWDDEKIKANLHLLVSNNIEEFIRLHRNRGGE